MRTIQATVAVLLASTMAAGAAQALTTTATNDINALTNALVVPGTGINVVTSNLAVSGGANQQGTYTGFNLAPSSGSTPTLNLPNGVVLSSGNAVVNSSNTVNETTVNTGTGSYAPLTTLAGASTFNANVLTYTFTLEASLNAVQAQFVYGTEEFPTQTVTDIFGFFVDGVNYAQFPNGDLIQNTPGNPTNFINNPVGGGLYGIEYNGLTQVFTVTGLIDTSLTEHTLTIAVADTADTRFDSAVYVGNLIGANSQGGGGIGDPGTQVPEPATLALLGMGLLGLGIARRRKA